MKKVKFMLMSLALIAVVGGALAFKAKYTDSFCTSFAPKNLAGQYICTTNGGAALSCPTLITNKRLVDPGTNPPVCTALPVQGTCGDAANTVPCINATTSIAPDNQ
jgi:hypothetical protein